MSTYLWRNAWQRTAPSRRCPNRRTTWSPLLSLDRHRYAPVCFVTLAVIVLCGCAGPFEIRKTKWSVPEVRDWYANYRKTEPHDWAWDGILYQGSDARWHHFCARVLSVDNWAIIQIKKADLELADERPYLTISSGAFGYYYYVDPSREFIKIRDLK